MVCNSIIDRIHGERTSPHHFIITATQEQIILNVLFISTEAAPFAKVGGMADVVGSLPAALSTHGIQARVLMPGYGFINHDKHNIKHLFSFQQPLKEGTADVHIYTTIKDNVIFYFLQSWPYFGSEQQVYTEWDWDSPRFIFFNQIAMGAIWEIGRRFNWYPDICHVNDWHTGLIPFLIEHNKDTPPWSRISTVLSIHNLAYQGDQTGGFMWKAGIPGRDHPELVSRNLTDNMLAIAIAYSNIVSTVSPRYAVEIQYPYMGYELDGIIRARAGDLYGILNGIDTNLWNPKTDIHLKANYDHQNFESNRPINKQALQTICHLPERTEVMVIGLVSRLVWQKGIDLAIPALRRFLAQYDVQFVALGTGEAAIEQDVRKLTEDFHWRAKSFIQFDASIAQLIYGGADLFLMPSHFEPCGMGQMIAMRYGALPLVRETGGLADTVENYDNADGLVGSGFTFEWEEADAVYGTLKWALDTYQNRPHAWRNMQRNAMQKDFSWHASAKRYIDLYQKAVNKRKGIV
ncbi:MAG: hypothetical protein CUN56_10225 [Phototrophicales bacterium]|nr:MAG: hypothetical protein CUN56_10225 [Phototrophicales bacterium]RMG76834.1 MAG: glycogen synthase [Chloroflexota bacterium]